MNSRSSFVVELVKAVAAVGGVVIALQLGGLSAASAAENPSGTDPVAEQLSDAEVDLGIVKPDWPGRINTAKSGAMEAV